MFIHKQNTCDGGRVPVTSVKCRSRALAKMELSKREYHDRFRPLIINYRISIEQSACVRAAPVRVYYENLHVVTHAARDTNVYFRIGNPETYIMLYLPDPRGWGHGFGPR